MRTTAAALTAVLLAACGRDVTEPSVAPPPDQPAFVLLAPGTVAQVSAGYAHTCALRIDGTVACWGSNGDGEATPPAGTFTQVSAGLLHTCGLRSDGIVACWGRDLEGQTTPPAGTFTQVSAGGLHTCGLQSDRAVACWGRDLDGQATPSAGTFTQVSAGDLHTCGVRSDGTVACWGDNGFGQATPPAGIFTEVTAGEKHTCGLRTDGIVTCWGSNASGQATPPAGTFTQVSAGVFHTCALGTDGTVACWGDNFLGEATPPAGTFTQVSAGSEYTCGVRSDGTVACWGDNGDQARPPVGRFTQVSVGGFHTCGVRSDGTVACWGDSFSFFGGVTAPAGTFTQVSAGLHTCGVRTDSTVACWGARSPFIGELTPPAGTFTQVSTGGVVIFIFTLPHACGVGTDGIVACWGDDSFGQATPPAGRFTLVSAGGRHTCGLQSNGTVACWGLNDFGQATPPAGTFTEVSAGTKHTCGVRSDSTVACWGDNEFGQAAPPAGTFAQVSAGGQVIAGFGESAGGDHTCGLRSDGTVACWGDNTFGRATPPAGSFTQVSAGSDYTCGLEPDASVACWGRRAIAQTPEPPLPPNRPPVPAPGGPYTGVEGSAVGFDAGGSSDPDGDAITFVWDFGDGAGATGVAPGHAYVDDGIFTVTLIVIDAGGLVVTATTTATIANVAPDVGAITGATILLTETFTAAGSFTDPGADDWSATVDYGDGSGAAALPLVGQTFSLSHAYPAAGTFPVTVRVSDDDGGVGVGQATVVVQSPEPTNRPPVAAPGGPYGAAEGSVVAFDADGSSDPDGDAISFAWDFGDGASASGEAPEHTYADDGTFMVTLTVTDAGGLAASATTTATIANVAPAVGPIPGATLLRAETFTAAGSFADPGLDAWSATVDYGDGSGVVALPLVGTTFSLNHVHAAAGTFVVTVRVLDGDGGVGVRQATVVVQSPRQATAALANTVDALVQAGELTAGNGNALGAKLEAAMERLRRGNTRAAVNQLEAFIRQVTDMVNSEELAAADGQRLIDTANRIIRAAQMP